MSNGSLDLNFRVAVADDAVELQPFVRSAYRGESSRKGWTTEADLLADERIDVEGLKEKITTPDSAVLLATDDAGVLVACCEVAKSADGVGYFGMFAVDPDRQGGGLGRRVLEYAEGYCSRVWGVTKMEMSVIWTREELISWYVRRGYKKTGVQKPFPYAELVNGVALRDDLYFEVMEKDLTADPVVSSTA
ncbi:related to N-acetyltransferase, GNAT family [Cephalotrichum gorgonifer]|uniref:Related to N-acetyltransferase, GNAT family n=1 Tax=Cephalotrichum gorgonifer TaxID=2041049 RepID=A0AAE8SSE5_9PEZI|nr:related to N-acetyltransferase, GNAT family [Cephalotrichum gorgonifer]